MALLALLWAYALSLAAVSAAGMTALIVRRALREHYDARRLERRQSLIAVLLTDVNPQTTNAPLAAVDSETVAETLLEALSLVRGADRDRMVATARRQGMHLTLRRQLARGHVRARILAAEALAFFPEAQTQRGLHAAQHDIDARVEVAALKSLIGLGAALSIDDLLARIAARGNGRLSALVGVLRTAVACQPAEAKRALTRTDLPMAVRVALIDSLAATRAGESAEIITTLIRDDDVDVRAAAVQALGVFAHVESGPAIAKCLEDKDWRVRVKAAEAAGRLGLPEFTGPLSGLLADDIWWVRLRASEALAALGQPGLAALRAIAANGELDRARRSARLALSERAAA